MGLKNTIIIEFNGLPGTGKSTIVNELKRLLEKDGYRVEKGYYHRIWEKFHYPFIIIPFCVTLYLKICRFSNSLKPRKYRTHQSGVVYYTRSYLKANKYCSSDFILIDQGIIQDIVTIAWLDKILPDDISPLSSVIMKIKKMNVKFLRVDCDNNIDLSEKRIIERPSKNHLFESFNSKSLRKALETQGDNFEIVRSLFNKYEVNPLSINIDTSVNPNENAIKIKKTILKYYEINCNN